MNEKEIVARELSKYILVSKNEILAVLEKPKYSNLGDISFPCFILAKKQNKNPYEIAQKLKDKLYPLPEEIEKVDVLGGYVNFFLDKKLLALPLINKILKEKNKYGSSKIGKGKKIVMDYSHPNIAKPMSIGHLRSTIIGSSLYKIFSFLGYECIGINYLGDFGTQFGKLIVAYKKWGSEDELKKNPISHLLKVYVKFHQEAEKNPELEEEARSEFKKLESGNKENVLLWKNFKSLSISEFKKLYSLLGVEFDVYSGESFYSEKAKTILKELKQKIAVESQKAFIVDLKEFNLPPFLVQKTDGSTLYSTRDIAAALDRYNKYKFDKMLYVVASEQNTYFRQLIKTLELMGYKWAKNCYHVNFGMIYMDEGKISTRKGDVIFLEDIIKKILALSRKFVENKDLTEKEKEKISKAVGISALIYSDLSNDRIKDIKFDWDKLLRLEGDSGPFLQYTYTRAKSILKKSGSEINPINIIPSSLSDEEKSLIILLNDFGSVVEKSAEHFSPHIIANYALKLADAFNSFYEKCPVINAEKSKKEFRLALTLSVSYVIKNALSLLGMSALERM